ncbi:MAG TPA: CcmD family protein [Vicinamibacterales bacterium]|jgi:CcmD family protein
MTKKLMALIVAFWLVGASGVRLVASTQGQSPQTPPTGQAAGAEPQDQFVPVKSLPQQEQLPAAPLLLTAYGFVWVVLLVYVWTIWRRLMKVEREMQVLSARVAEKSGRG